MKKLIYIISVLLLALSFAQSSIEDYQQIYKESNQEFLQQMSKEIKKNITNTPRKVQEAYKAIDYQPIWVDKDYLSAYAEILISELKDDFKKGLHKELVNEYNKLMPNEDAIFTTDSIEQKVKVELGIMKLYLDSIHDILKDKKSKHTAISLLQKAISEKSLLQALNAISAERITASTSQLDINMTATQKAQLQENRKLAQQLLGSDKKARLKAVYELVEYKPIWLNDSGKPTPFANVLFKHIEDDITLEHNDTIYQEYQLLKNKNKPSNKKERLHREIAISKLYQDYMEHVLYGDINWQKFLHKLHKNYKHGVWVVHNVLASPESLLIEAIYNNDLEKTFDKALPDIQMYKTLLTGLAKYKKLSLDGGWEPLPSFKAIKPNEHSDIIPLLRQRLAKEGFYDPTSCPKITDETEYDKCLVEAIKKFQRLHGLEDEGYIGKMTQKALAESAKSKVARIKLNLDRLKWLKRTSDRYHIVINIPAFTLYMFDGHDVIQKMRVITGRKGHETPIFYGRVRTIVLNPYWRIPPSIVRHETVPKLQKDSGYCNKKHIEIHTGYSEHSSRVNPYKVNWHKYSKKLPPYKFMQSPGEFNALGKVKYLFPNKYSVYMHDTNEKHLFVKDIRALSHGCVRLHKPFDLLQTFCKIEPKLDYDKSQGILKENKKTPYRLSQTIPVDIIYLTTWVNSDGEVEFRDDIYGYDKLHMQTEK
jgi:murein L,D-transpeptidase YcbB/YkuD